jgi:hypothetical protein
MTLTRKLTFLLLMSIRAPERPGGAESSGVIGPQQGCAGFFRALNDQT